MRTRSSLKGLFVSVGSQPKVSCRTEKPDASYSNIFIFRDVTLERHDVLGSDGRVAGRVRVEVAGLELGQRLGVLEDDRHVHLVREREFLLVVVRVALVAKADGGRVLIQDPRPGADHVNLDVEGGVRLLRHDVRLAGLPRRQGRQQEDDRLRQLENDRPRVRRCYGEYRRVRIRGVREEAPVRALLGKAVPAERDVFNVERTCVHRRLVVPLDALTHLERELQAVAGPFPGLHHLRDDVLVAGLLEVTGLFVDEMAVDHVLVLVLRRLVHVDVKVGRLAAGKPLDRAAALRLLGSIDGLGNESGRRRIAACAVVAAAGSQKRRGCRTGPEGGECATPAQPL